MSTLGLYKFFKRHRILLLVLVILAFGSTIYFGTKIKLEEDINKFIPKDKKIDEINFVLNNIKIKDKLVINIFNIQYGKCRIYSTIILIFCSREKYLGIRR